MLKFVSADGEMSVEQVPIAETERDALQQILNEAPDYYKRVTGAVAAENAAEKLLEALPGGKAFSDKVLCKIIYQGQLIGYTDIIKAFPDDQTALLGLLLISEKFHGDGFGKKAFQLIEQQVKDWGYKRIWLAVIRVNEVVFPFWQKMGFVPTGETRPYTRNSIVSESVLMHKKFGD